MSDMLRLTGLSSGMDTDTMVTKLIALEQVKVDRVEQEKQYMEWQKEDYREIANLIRGFNDDYFDVLKPETNIRSTSTFNMFSSKAAVSGVESSAVSINTSVSSLVESFSIDSITQLASNDAYKSSTEIFGDIKSSDIINAIDSIDSLVATDNTLEFTFDGSTKIIELDGGYTTYADFTTDLSDKLQKAFENVDITVTENAGILQFDIYKNGTGDIDGDGSHQIELGHTIEVGSENFSLVNAMELVPGQSTSLDTSKSLSDVFAYNVNAEFTINGVEFDFNRDTKVFEVISEINASSAGVTMTYDGFTDKFTLSSTTAGTNNAIEFTDTTGLLADLKIDAGAHVGAMNAIFTVNGVDTTRASNTFEINGTSITLKETSTDPIDITVSSDTTDVKDMIVKFVASYNDMISKVNDMVATSKNRDYAPLTDLQKESMSDENIATWETEARKGTLKNDSALSAFTRDLRNSMYETIEGVDITLFDLGITSSANYKDQGKLIIDEDKLDKALLERPNEVVELFTKQSEFAYTDESDRGTRDSENGIASRIFDILQDNIRITRNDNGAKGYLIEKAGFGTGVDTTSEIAQKLAAMDVRIDYLLELLQDKEDTYYSQFSAMETAMSTLQAQGASLMSQLGG